MVTFFPLNLALRMPIVSGHSSLYSFSLTAPNGRFTVEAQGVKGKNKSVKVPFARRPETVSK